MNARNRKLLAFILVCVSLFSALAQPASAIQWSGDASGAGGNATGFGVNGFAIARDDDNLAGYRFSVVDKEGNTYNNLAIDIFRDTSLARWSYYLQYANWGHKFKPKYNKVQWIANQNKGFSTGQTQSNTFLEGADVFFASAMPITTGIEKWVQNAKNLNAILSKLSFTSVQQLKNGDKVLVEPLYFIMINDNYHTMTVTEIGVFGKAAYGGKSDGGDNYTAGHWGFIKKYTNRIYPNSLYEPTGADGLWTGATYIDGYYSSFQRLINYGYGVGIAYTVKNDKAYTVQYIGNGADSGTTPDSQHEFDVAKNLNANGYKKEHYIFTKWNTKPDGSGVSYKNKQSVVNLAKKPGDVVKLYAIWEVDPVLAIEAKEPNSSYREGVTVITSFNVINKTDDKDFIPSDKVTVKFTAYDGSKVIYTETRKDVVVPKGKTNLVYFKWTVPKTVNSGKIKVSGEVYLENLKIDQDAIQVTAGNVANYQTPDTDYEAQKPSGWKSKSLSASLKTATWHEWVYKNGKFVQKHYKISLSSATISVTPDPNSPSASGSTLKSGYGFSIRWKPKVTSTGKNNATGSMYTLPQTAYAIFPEFQYAKTSGRCRLLEPQSGTFVFKANPDAEGDRLHFTPLWYPNGSYTVGVYAYDCWTPAGMIKMTDVANSLTINGSLYDDYFIGRK